MCTTKRKIEKKDILRMSAAAVCVAAAFTGVGFGLKYMESKRVVPQQQVPYSSMEPTNVTAPIAATNLTAPTGFASDTSVLVIGDDTYQRNPNVKAYLFLGIDCDDPVRARPGRGGQADTQLLLVVDAAAQTWQLLPINRDTLTDVNVLGVLGDVLSTERQQIALAHAYGDGLRKSCRNAVKAVSHLLGDSPIEGYYALNMGGISAVVDSIGGIEVTIPRDYTNLDPAFVEGAHLNLTGKQAYKLLRTRHGVDDQTNIARMERQNLVLEAATKKLHTLSGNDCIVAFNAVSDYAVTDLGSAEILELKELTDQYQQLPSLHIEGEAFLQGEFMAFEPDADSLQNAILQLFYTKKEMR